MYVNYEQLRDALSQPTDPRHVKTRQQGGAQIPYLEWHYVNERLNEVAPGWSGECQVTISGDLVVAVYCISIPTADGVVKRCASGSERLSAGFDPVASAEQQSFKRAAARFGIGLDLYESPRNRGYIKRT